MDGLLILLILLGIFSSIGKKKKKQEEKLKKYRRDNAFAEAFPEETKKAAQAAAVKKAPEPAKKAAASAIKKAAEPAIKAMQQEIPFTKEEWNKFLGGIDQKKSAAVHAQAMPEGFSPKLKSTQGESEAEHRRHLEKIAAQEKLQQEKLENARELRSMNRQKLRQAVIMSEILEKPVALRKRS